MTTRVRVVVTPKAGVLDPQGKAIEGALKSLGFSGVAAARQGKVIDLVLDETDPDKARAAATAMAEKLLANQVMESFRVEVAG